MVVDENGNKYWSTGLASIALYCGYDKDETDFVVYTESGSTAEPTEMKKPELLKIIEEEISSLQKLREELTEVVNG